MKEIRFSDHSQIKLKILNEHRMGVTKDFVLETLIKPDKREIFEDNKRIAQKRWNNSLVLRVVTREFSSFILIITLYPGRRSRYEKNDLQ